MAARRIFLSLLLATLALPGWATSEDEANAGQDIDLGQMLQMGLALGKQYLGEAGVEKIKKGDFSELIDLGEKFLGEGGVNSLVSAAAKEFLNVEEKDWLKTGEKERSRGRGRRSIKSPQQTENTYSLLMAATLTNRLETM